jgi:hypothetical protein
MRSGASVVDMLRNGSNNPADPAPSLSTTVAQAEPPGAEELTLEEKLTVRRKAEDDDLVAQREQESARRKIFDGLVVYVNGSTYPSISDHRLKHVLAENGARTSLHLSRRLVTHVVLGKPVTAGTSGGAGGGLAGGKLEKEIRRLRGCGVKFVSVDWYESLPS